MRKLLPLLGLCFAGFGSYAQPGTLDQTFDPGTGANGTVYASSIQNDGKIIIGGTFTSYNGTAINRIARLNMDGTLDSSFAPGTGASNIVRTTSIQPDGKIIIGGQFTSFNGTTINRIARLNMDGTLDSSFTTGTGPNSYVNTTSIQGDGKIIICGNFSGYNGTAINHIARLNTDGTLDNSFNPGTGISTDVNNEVYATSIQPDGKIIIGGFFNSFNGTTTNCIARLNTDGTLDSSFTTGTGANSEVWTTSVQSDGKIIIGGLFTSFNATITNHIARLNTDGTLDSSFIPGAIDPGTGEIDYVTTTTIQGDGKIIFGGLFSTFSGSHSSRIARLNTDGTLDGSFTTGIGTFGDVYATSIQSDGKIIVGGGFTSYNGTGINRIVRLMGDNGVLEIDEVPLSYTQSELRVYPNPAKENFKLEILNVELKNAEVKVCNVLGRRIYDLGFTVYEQYITVDCSGWSSGVYFVEVGGQRTKLVKE